MPTSSYQKFKAVTNAADRAELDALAAQLGGTAIYSRGVVEYKVRGNGTKSTRSVGLGELPNLVPHARETDNASDAANDAAQQAVRDGVASPDVGTYNPAGALGGSTAGATGGGILPPSVNLQPGSTDTAAVKQLQDYLVANGYMTQAQVDTGYGTYGPQTTAAVAALQKSKGVDNSTGVGYYGPRTIAAIGGAGAAAGSTAGAGAAAGAGATSPGTVSPDLLSLLEDPNLSADQKAAIQSIYNAVLSNDADSAEKIKAAMAAASKYSDPYFKAQIRLATDALDRGLSSKDGDLAFAEKQQNDALAELTANIGASKDMLSFDHQQELQQLAVKYETDLGTTRDNLAASGFTNSSKRARTEQILGDNNTGMVESSTKKFGYETGNLDRKLAAENVSVADQIANLRRLTQEGKLNLYRGAEETVGSDNLPSVSGLNALGGVGGTIPRDQMKDALSFASNFVY